VLLLKKEENSTNKLIQVRIIPGPKSLLGVVDVLDLPNKKILFFAKDNEV